MIKSSRASLAGSTERTLFPCEFQLCFLISWQCIFWRYPTHFVSSKQSSALKAFRCHISLCLFFLFFPMSSALMSQKATCLQVFLLVLWVDTHCFSWRRGWRRSAAYWFRSGHWCPDSGSQQRRRWGSVSTCCHTTWSACSPLSRPACSWGENASKPIRED